MSDLAAAREALEHCVKVFKSTGDRGAYPLELLPFNHNSIEPSPHFLGKQGYHWAIDALTATPTDAAKEYE